MPPETEPPEPESPAGDPLCLVDGYNVLHAGLFPDMARDEWWTAPHRERLIARLGAYTGRERLVVVFDGERPLEDADAGCGSPAVVFAPDADAWILARVREASGAAVSVVTRDRKLAGRAAHRGARILDPSELLALCPAPP